MKSWCIVASHEELESRLATVAEQEKLAQTFESCVQKMPELERQVERLTRENDMLRACSANTRLLEEKVASASDEIALLQQRCDEAAQLRAQLDSTKDLLSAVKDVLRTELCLSSSPEPDTLRSVLRQLRSSDQSLTDAIKTMKESLAAHERRNAELENEVKELREKSALQQQSSQRHLQLARRQQRKLLLVSKERDSLKTILTSYEAEVTMTSATTANSGRLASLEEILTQHKQELARLEQELDYYQQAPQRPGEPAIMSSKDRAELCNLKDQVTQLKEEVSKLQEEKEVLEYRLEQRAMKGDYDPSQVNVLHMKENPMSEAVGNYDNERAKLQQEVQQLKEQLAATASAASEAASKDLACISSATQISDNAEADKLKVQELEKELKNMEVKHERYMDAFKDRSKEMRELVYRLTGYLVKPTDENNCYKLSNMYAESPDDFFMFEMASNGEINLLSTDFSNSLEDMIDAYLNHENSYPAFLSAVTIDLFNRQTMVAGAPSRGLSPANTSEVRAAKTSEDGEGDSDGERRDEDNAMEDEDASDDGDHDDEEPIDSDSEGEVGPRVDIPGDEDDDDDDDEDEDDDDEEEDERQPANNVQDDGSDDDLICLD
ncbi:Spindle assembly checkpoint component Mad1 [Trinorchestia longiramus]|nr:Spindle assembly checkpoint component Mad1 [Trinorchestia longiramus]